MYIDELKLIDFRNYSEANITFNPELNVIIGDNAQGKTNIVEAIFYSSFGKSFRTSRDRELIRDGSDMAYIKIGCKRRYKDLSIELRLWKNKKKEIKINRYNLSKLSELLGNINVVVFSPEDISLIKGGPAERRKFIDRELSNISRNYYNSIMSYNKVLNQRNNLLRSCQFNPSLINTIDIWDNQIIDYGVKVMRIRKNFIDKLNAISNSLHKKITNNKENIELKYITNIKYDDKDFEESVKSNFKDCLLKKRDLEIKRGHTIYGPHKDDIGIYVNDKDIRVYGSQGQQRTSALSLKLSEIQIIHDEVGEYPILLLDDVMSELDKERQRYLVEGLDDVQIFITMTELTPAIESISNRGNVYSIENGQVVDIQINK